MNEFIENICRWLLAAGILTSGFLLFLYDMIQQEIDIARITYLVYQRAQEVR